MTTRLEDAPLVTDNGGDDADDLDHYFCFCSEFIGLCGADLTLVPLVGGEGDPVDQCVVCDLMNLCPRCGRRFP